MFEQKDLLLRQIEHFVTALLQRLAGREVGELGEGVEAATGLDLDTALRFPTEVLVGLVTTADGPDARKLMLLALGLASRATGEDAEPVMERARDLAMWAVRIDPALAEVPGLAEALGWRDG